MGFISDTVKLIIIDGKKRGKEGNGHAMFIVENEHPECDLL